MGKEWLNWGGGFSSKSAKSGRFSREKNEAAAPPSGCMCAVFQIFDFNHFQFALHHQPSFQPGAFLEDEVTIPKGVEAPRNSLELEETSCEVASSSSSTIKDDASLNIPVGFQIRTSCENTKSTRESTSECSRCSPGTKTPGVVARLMGLDTLPGGGSPSLSSSRHSTSSPSVLKSRNYLHHQVLNHHNEDRSRHLLQTKPGRNGGNGAHSLPVSPRMSSARRSDVDHRLSLQINKENVFQELDLADYVAKKVARRREVNQDNESRSPGYYARQIVKQVKESVSRKVGADITNTINVPPRAQTRSPKLCAPRVTIKTRDNQPQLKDDERVVLQKPKKQSRLSKRPGDDECSLSKQSALSSSPRLRTLPDKNRASHSPKLPTSPSAAAKPSRAQATNPARSIDELTTNASRYTVAEGKSSLEPKPDHVQLPQQQNFQHKSMQKCEKVYNSERLKRPPQASSDAVRSKKQEPFVRSPSKSKVNNHLTDKMCKKIPLSNELLMNNYVPALLPVKKDCSPVTKLIHHTQVSDALTSKRDTQLSSCASQSPYNHQTTHKSTTVIFRNSQDTCNVAATTSAGSGGAEYQYIKTIIKRTGIDQATPVSLAKWYSPSHPLDPAIFHYVELFHHTNTIFTAKESRLSHRSNRKLIFQLVDELLAEILKPFINSKPWLIPLSRQCCEMEGCELIDALCSRIQAFPSANCQVLDDVDALIEQDLHNVEQLKRSIAFVEEGESIVLEIERDIMDSLVHEMVLEV